MYRIDNRKDKIMNKAVVEICCGSVNDALAAFHGGADRIELNSALFMGGLTPSLGTLTHIRKMIDMNIITMVRPRGAGFCYDRIEKETMLYDAELMMQNGAKGVAFGFLNENGTIDRESTASMVRLVHSYGGEAVFHRAFDCTSNMTEALEILISNGVDRILTSGGRNTAVEGQDMLLRLNTAAAGRIELVAGSGVNDGNCMELMNATGIRQIHSSCKEWKNDPTTSVNNISFSYAQGSISNSYDMVSEEKVRKLCLSIRLCRQ